MLKTTLLIPLLLGLTIQGCKEETSTTATPLKTVKKDSFTLHTTTKETITIKKKDAGYTLASQKKQLLLLNIFATWCPPCRAEASVLSSLGKKFEKDLNIVALSIESGIDDSKLIDFAQKFDANYTIVNDPNSKELIDEILQKLDLQKEFPIPLTLLYKDGKLINHYIGAVEEEFLQSDIKQAIGK